MACIAQRLLQHAQANGVLITIYQPQTEPDYSGTSAADAWKAVEACEENHAQFHDPDGNCLGWAILLPGLADDETIADYSGDWIDKFWQGEQ